MRRAGLKVFDKLIQESLEGRILLAYEALINYSDCQCACFLCARLSLVSLHFGDRFNQSHSKKTVLRFRSGLF